MEKLLINILDHHNLLEKIVLISYNAICYSSYHLVSDFTLLLIIIYNEEQMDNLKSTTDLSITSIKNFTYNIDGVSKADSGNYTEALEYFSKAIKNDPYNFVSYFNRASIRMQIGDIDGARRDFKKAESLDPERNFYS